MTDVVEIANERRVRLAAEIGKLDDFLRMAESLMKDGVLETPKTSNAENEKATKSNGPAKTLSDSSNSKSTGVDIDDYSVRELKTEDKLFGALTKNTEASAERQGIFRRASS
ncbi:MAG TPA: hypothetical protein VMY41_05140 [Thermohalobaculum sp.]|nr:hypothetical protein [Thermohalobaculum sp.]